MTTRRSMVGRKSARVARSPARRDGTVPARTGRSRSPARRRPAGPPFLSLLRLLYVPAAVTLGVTLLRLTGERLEWSPPFFSRLPGGGLAIVGITWLIPLVGYYLGDRLTRARANPGSLRRAAGLPVAALVLVPLLAGIAARMAPDRSPMEHLTIWAVASVVGLGIAWAGWPRLGTLLFAYALVARVPVVLVMGLAIRGGWGTHYDALPPGFPPMTPPVQWWWTGIVPQLTIWVALTVVVGALAGAVGWQRIARSSA